MALEIRKINEGIAAERRSLLSLLGEAEPSTVTRSGERYLFRKDVLEQLGAVIPREMQVRLKLPILFHTTPMVPDSCYLSEEISVQALKMLGEISDLREMRDGKLWVAKPIAYALTLRYPTAVQVIIGF